MRHRITKENEMRRIDVEVSLGAVSEESAFAANTYANSGSYLNDYNRKPSRTAPGSLMASYRFTAFKQGCVQVAGPWGKLP